MNLRTIGSLSFIFLFCSNALQAQLRRSESFFGFHFDFHATASDSLLGKNFNRSYLDSFLRVTAPDFVQIDSKGHPGFSSYPTTIGTTTNSFLADPIQLWREVTRQNKIPLFVHHSGLWDQQVIKEHPDWGRLNADGTRDELKVGYLSPYSSQRLLPQLKELVDNYQIDGAWIDGDCWATAPDYDEEVVAGFKKQYPGIEVPRSKSAPYYQEWLEYNRQMFRKYLKNYVDAMHSYKPSFQITSNWAYSSMMPVPVDVSVDFLSGDVSGQNCLYSAAFQARCLALQGKPWDLMAWGFTPVDFWGGTHTTKGLVQLQQEAAEVMAMGGGFQVYFQQNRDASLRSLDLPALQQLAQFCRDRQPFCQYSEQVPQIGMWYSLEGWKKRYEGVYGWSSDMEAINSLLLDAQQPVEILMDHHIENRLSSYPLVVIPEWDAFQPALKTKLIQYLEAGGHVLVIGATASRAFKDQLAVDFIGTDSTIHFHVGGKEAGGMAGIKTKWQQVIPRPGTQIVAKTFIQSDENSATNYPMATVNTYGKGKIGAIYTDLSSAYYSNRSPVFNEIVKQVIAQLVPEQLIRVTGDKGVHVALAKKQNDLLVHLINASGDHSNKTVYAYHQLRPVETLQVDIKLAKKPAAVWLEPSHDKMKFSYKNGVLSIKVPKVDLHSIIRIIQ